MAIADIQLIRYSSFCVLMANGVMAHCCDKNSSCTGLSLTTGDSRLTQQVRARILRKNAEYQALKDIASAQDTRLLDFLVHAAEPVPEPAAIFERLRWGGQFLFVSRDRDLVERISRQYDHQHGFVLEQESASLIEPWFGLRFSFLAKKLHYFIARKTLLIPPGSSTDRFTYHVELIRHPRFGSDYVVMKQVPEFERVLARLREKFPDVDSDTLEKRARKFTDKIFPIFLTREAGMLRVLAKHLPPEYRNRVPHEIGIEKDNHGFVRTLYMNWLRNGGAPISQLAFARQSAELLTVLHETARVIHLDLRLDNFVITPQGVGFVDFGSAVRAEEEFAETSLLNTLYEEMMRTSQIQKMLGKMQERGLVTSEEIRGAYGKIDKAVDFFYLAVQMNHPQANPDFRDLVTVNPESEEAKAIAALTDRILRPADTARPEFTSARSILNGLIEIEKSLHSTPAPAEAA